MRYGEQRAGRSIVHVEIEPGVVTILPKWMFDAGICSGMILGAPRVSADALRDLHRLLILRGFRRSLSGDFSVSQEDQDGRTAEDPQDRGCDAAGGSASDDPEGAVVLKEVFREAQSDPDIKVLELPAWAPLEVNALQRASTVVIQKSLREGFGLTVSEALWKKKPVVASAVGAIPIQIIHKHTGLLSHSIEGTAYQIRFLLSHPEIAAKLGEQGHQHVKENFLITQKLKRYLTLFLTLSRNS